MDNKIREPRQQRAIEKKEAIIKAAYKVFTKDGYYNTNTAEIAKVAGVSTGIVYGYFKDKKDILFYVIQIYIRDVSAPVNEFIDSLTAPIDFEKLANNLIALVTKVHKINANIHNVLHSLAGTDDEINEEFMRLETDLTNKGAIKLAELGVKSPNLKEKVHLIMNLVQSYVHESLYDKHEYLDYEKMKKDVCDCIVCLFK